jgi:maleate isomerase
MPTTRIAIMAPSSNTVVEPGCGRMVAAIPGATAHFARVEVLWIDDGADSLAQFQEAPMNEACTLLSHVRPAVICWGGTAASWLGLNWDRALVARMAAVTGCPAVTATLSILEALRELGSPKVGLVTPYVAEIQNRVIATLRGEGVDVVAERHFEMTDNFSFGMVPEERIAEAARAVISDGAEAVIILCTNLAGAGIAKVIEDETGVPVLDSVTLTVWGALRAVGHDTRSLSPWGPAVAGLSAVAGDDMNK